MLEMLTGVLDMLIPDKEEVRKIGIQSFVEFWMSDAKGLGLWALTDIKVEKFCFHFEAWRFLAVSSKL